MCQARATCHNLVVYLQLSRAVEAWEPRQERVPLHAWLHPWLPMLAPRLADLHPGIRFKLATALQQWHPGDQSAMALLSPWHQVLPLSVQLPAHACRSGDSPAQHRHVHQQQRGQQLLLCTLPNVS